MPSKFKTAKRPPCTVGKNPYQKNREELAVIIRSRHRWHAQSRDFRIKNPLCCDPFKRHELLPERATTVHHVFRIEEFPQWAHRTWNLRPLCNACHGSVDALEREGGRKAMLLFVSRRELRAREAGYDEDWRETR